MSHAPKTSQTPLPDRLVGLGYVGLLDPAVPRVRVMARQVEATSGRDATVRFTRAWVPGGEHGWVLNLGTDLQGVWPTEKRLQSATQTAEIPVGSVLVTVGYGIRNDERSGVLTPTAELVSMDGQRHPVAYTIQEGAYHVRHPDYGPVIV